MVSTIDDRLEPPDWWKTDYPAFRKAWLERYKGMPRREYKLNVYTVHEVTVEAGSDEEAKARAALEVQVCRVPVHKVLAVGPFPRPKEEDGIARATEDAHENS